MELRILDLSGNIRIVEYVPNDTQLEFKNNKINLGGYIFPLNSDVHIYRKDNLITVQY